MDCNKKEAEKTFLEYAKDVNGTRSHQCESCDKLVYKDGIMTCSVASSSDKKSE